MKLIKINTEVQDAMGNTYPSVLVSYSINFSNAVAQVVNFPLAYYKDEENYNKQTASLQILNPTPIAGMQLPVMAIDMPMTYNEQETYTADSIATLVQVGLIGIFGDGTATII